MDVIDARTLTLVERVSTEPGAHTSAYDPKRNLLFVFLPESCRADIFAEEQRV